MQILSLNPFSRRSLKRLQRRKKTTKTIRLGGGSPRRRWRIKVVPKLRLKFVLLSPLRVWRKIKNAYVNMMLTLADNQNVFGEKRIPKDRRRRQASVAYSSAEFDNRLVLEIYKSLVASRELATIN